MPELRACFPIPEINRMELVMNDFNPKLGIWNRKRTLADGAVVKQRRHTVNWVCPETGVKRRKAFECKSAAEAYRAQLIAEVSGERYFNPGANPTVAEMVEHWREVKRGTVKDQTLRGYEPLLRIIVGPLLQGTPQQRVHYTLTGQKPSRDTKLLKMLGEVHVSALTTGQLRRWHGQIRDEVGAVTAGRVMSMLKSILALAQEDFGVRVCPMPTNLSRRKAKPKKDILSAEEVAQLLDHAKQDAERGIFYAFPFLTGVRVSEQLGLLWEDVDLDAGLIRICRIQEHDGSLTDQTKTEAGVREIPICATLGSMLLQWRLTCPRLNGELHRVFPGPGVPQAWPKPRIGGGVPVLYSNFLKRYWRPAFAKAGVRYVTHHSARHSFVSTLQAQGVEVGLVAKLAGHANPAVTLGHYTQAVRGGGDAVALLDQAYGAGR